MRMEWNILLMNPLIGQQQEKRGAMFSIRTIIAMAIIINGHGFLTVVESNSLIYGHLSITGYGQGN